MSFVRSCKYTKETLSYTRWRIQGATQSRLESAGTLRKVNNEIVPEAQIFWLLSVHFGAHRRPPGSAADGPLASVRIELNFVHMKTQEGPKPVESGTGSVRAVWRSLSLNKK